MILSNTVPNPVTLLCAACLAIPALTFANTGYVSLKDKTKQLEEPTIGPYMQSSILLLVATYDPVAGATYTATGTITPADQKETSCAAKVAWGSLPNGINGGGTEAMMEIPAGGKGLGQRYLSMTIGGCAELPYGPVTIQYSVRVSP